MHTQIIYRIAPHSLLAQHTICIKRCASLRTCIQIKSGEKEVKVPRSNGQRVGSPPNRFQLCDRQRLPHTQPHRHDQPRRAYHCRHPLLFSPTNGSQVAAQLQAAFLEARKHLRRDPGVVDGAQGPSADDGMQAGKGCSGEGAAAADDVAEVLQRLCVLDET